MECGKLNFLSCVTALCIVAGMSGCGHKAISGDEETVRVRRDSAINEAITVLLERYPASRYDDVYKNFMQDYFGPGHILGDTARSGAYLRKELSETTRFDGALYEPTGYEGNFYRVNLSLIRDSVIDYPVYFDAFVRSVSAIEPPSLPEWRRKWAVIDSILLTTGYSYDSLKSDRNRILLQLESGDPIVHHSRIFNDTYSVHYRIISRDIFESEILPLLPKTE
ncbi:MAG: hypothetical protein K2H47_11595 [Muribaculaceae bacterium]|nr:hypothetical protein [Muribaculaceae bacterium]